MYKEHRELVITIIIGILQAVATAVVGHFLQGGKMLIPFIIIVNIVVFVLVYRFINNKFKLYKRVGIIGCTEKLQGTQFEPRKCMKSVNKYLDFMGVGGNKWVDQDDKMELFLAMLERVKATNGKVRYLLINPNSKSFAQLKKLRKNKVPSSSYYKFKELVAKYDCLEVRLYDDLPSFRLQFVDQEYVAVSRYYIEHELHEKANFGWKIPHLIVRAEKITNIQKGQTEYQLTLYKSFEQLYQYIWEHSEILTKHYIIQQEEHING